MRLKHLIFIIETRWRAFQWKFVERFMPKTCAKWTKEFEEQCARDFIADYNYHQAIVYTEMYWQYCMWCRQRGR